MIYTKRICLKCVLCINIYDLHIYVKLYVTSLQYPTYYILTREFPWTCFSPTDIKNRCLMFILKRFYFLFKKIL